MRTGPHDASRLEAARDYLAAFLADENIHGEESLKWFGDLGEYVEQLRADDQLIRNSAVYLQPFLDDDERIDCAMYPGGEASIYLEQGWGGDFRSYLTGFLEAMRRDHELWEDILRECEQDARWTLDDGPSVP